jgi:hypothetical protein
LDLKRGRRFVELGDFSFEIHPGPSAVDADAVGYANIAPGAESVDQTEGSK